MSKYESIAKSVLDAVGGKENIESAYHCMTRLRLLLLDYNKVDVAALKSSAGILGHVRAEGQLQVIIGPSVEMVYKAFIALAGLENSSASIEKKASLQKQKNPLILVSDGILKAFAASVSPLIPILIITGVFNLAAILLGPTFFKVITTESRLYTNLYFTAQSILYFLPMFVAYTASKHFGCSSLITMSICAFMLYPNFLEIVEAGAAYTFFGLPMELNNYSSALLPFILISFVQSYVERGLKKVIPDMLKTILHPTLTMAVMMPLSMCLLAPISTWIGRGLNAALVWLYTVAGPLETTLVGAVAILGVAFGFLRPVYFTGLMAFLSTGVDYTVLPMLAVICNFVAMGATVGYIIRTHDEGGKQLGVTCLVTNALGGVSEPAIYGIFMVKKRVMVATILGGAVAGLIQGILKVGYFQRATSNIFGVLSFVSEGNPANLTNALITCAIAFVSTMVFTMVLYRHDETV